MTKDVYLHIIDNKIANIRYGQFDCMGPLKGLTVQDCFLDILYIEQFQLTWKSIMYHIPQNILQFAVNASIDTLPTNANLKC